jgi:hypothetical protein
MDSVEALLDASSDDLHAEVLRCETLLAGGVGGEERSR